MSAYAQHSHPLPMHTPSAHPEHAQPQRHQPRQYSDASTNFEIRSPLDLLSRVALGQYPTSFSEHTSTQTPSPTTSPSPRLQQVTPPSQQQKAPQVPPPPPPPPRRAPFHPPPKQTPLEPAIVNKLPEIRFRPLEFPQRPYLPISGVPVVSPTSASYPKERTIFSSDFSPVSSEDCMPSRPTHQPPELPPRITKVMRVSKEGQPSVKSRSQPSRFCHICSRTSKKVGLVACGNFATGACRKVVCQKCFFDHKWDWDAAFKMGSKWICTHCRQACPDRAQCAIYKRTNERRREQQQLQRSNRSETVMAYRSGQGRFDNKQYQ